MVSALTRAHALTDTGTGTPQISIPATDLTTALHIALNQGLTLDPPRHIADSYAGSSTADITAHGNGRAGDAPPPSPSQATPMPTASSLSRRLEFTSMHRGGSEVGSVASSAAAPAIAHAEPPPKPASRSKQMQAAVPTLLFALGDRDPTVRTQAAECLASVPLRVLQRALSGPAIRNATCDALGIRRSARGASRAGAGRKGGASPTRTALSASQGRMRGRDGTPRVPRPAPSTPALYGKADGGRVRDWPSTLRAGATAEGEGIHSHKGYVDACVWCAVRVAVRLWRAIIDLCGVFAVYTARLPRVKSFHRRLRSSVALPARPTPPPDNL